MAEAAVEDRPQNQRFFCHKCSVEFDHVSPEYTCPRCMGGFIEELEANTEGSDDIIDVDDEENPAISWGAELDDFLFELEDRSRTPRTRIRNLPHRRRYASVHPRYRIGRPRAIATRISGLRQQTPFENLIQDFIVNLGVNWGGPNQVSGNMLFLGNPGDYAWGREGLDAIVTQLLNQMDGTGPPPLSKELIDTIPTALITQEQVDAKVQCSVCWEDFVLNETVRKLPCQHVYHENCICPWLELHGTCPICRQNLAPSNDNSQNNTSSNNTGYAALHDFFQAVNDSGNSNQNSPLTGSSLQSSVTTNTNDSASSSSSSSTTSSSTGNQQNSSRFSNSSSSDYNSDFN